MRILSFLSILLIAFFLAGCGGGGGSPGSNPNRPTITTTAPDNLSLPLGVVNQYAVQGGVSPYTISTSNPRIAAVSLSGGNFWINTVGQGEATVTLRDNNGGIASIVVTVGDELKLSTDTIKSYVGDQVIVQITGGTPPFRASSLDTGVTAFVSGRELVLNLVAVSKIDVTVIDALNQQAKVNVEVIAGSPQFNLVPLVQTVSENSEEPIYLNVIGGKGALTVESSDSNLLKASISGRRVTLTTGTNGERCVPGPAPSTVTITVVDSQGGFATADVLLADNPAGCGLRVSSNPVAVVVGSSVKLTVTGISPQGTVTVNSSNPSKATASYSDGVITVNGVASTQASPALPIGCGPVLPSPPCLTPAVPASPVTMTVIDSGPPTRSSTFIVNVLP